MSFEKFHFTEYCHCPHCKTSLIIVDNEILSCPLCEVKRSEKAQKFGREKYISQRIF